MNNVIIEINTIKECVICLSNQGNLEIYTGRCNCKPPIHRECLEEWQKIQPDSCLICRKNSNNLTPTEENRNTNLIIVVYNQHRIIFIIGALGCMIFTGCLLFIVIFMMVNNIHR